MPVRLLVRALQDCGVRERCAKEAKYLESGVGLLGVHARSSHASWVGPSRCAGGLY